MHRIALPWLAFLAVAVSACYQPDSGSVEETSTPTGLSVVVIASPTEGLEVYAGDPVVLAAAVTDKTTGEAIDDAVVHWTAPLWSFVGATGTPTDLPIGDITLEASAVSLGQTAQDSVSLTVMPPFKNYSGQVTATVRIESSTLGIMEYPCDGEVGFVVERHSTLMGNGSCHNEDLAAEVAFDFSGTFEGAEVSGVLSGGYLGVEYEADFSASELDDGVLMGTSSGEMILSEWDMYVTVDLAFTSAPDSAP